VRTAVEAEIAAMPETVRRSALALAAITLAGRLDEAAHRDTPPIARELRATLADLRLLAEKADQEVDQVDDLAARRTARLKAAQAQAGASGGDDRGA